MDAVHVEERISFQSGGLMLEGILAYPEEGDPAYAVLLIAPHPHLGGTMENNVVRHLAAAAAADGAVSLRFNYRGVGNSEIRLSAGETLYAHWEQMEQHLRYDEILPDARAALDALASAAPSARIAVVGYSLGAVLAGMLAPDDRVTRVAAVAPPVKRVGLTVYAGCRKPKLFVAGDRDFAFDSERFAREFNDLPSPKQFVPFPNGDHFFRKEEQVLYTLLKPYFFSEAVGDGPTSSLATSREPEHL